ncbi:DNA primase [Xinfangfangia sp. CPCC 101601]|uniref:DNA primase n=1 Tax=Pseudogemmobacter lacusdianii TaxID=3069608 RepID=A0ABU0VVS4_9RHOB|nr:DNA primase [Xinfangfangia sp. CPCC 101601]MDQ2065738.1 DNA primase [Xinfangfangia sp. CPCC 101601]
MSLPPGFLDELRSRVSLSAVVGRKVTWDMRKSNMAKGDWWSPCPFHQEKSASFHVDDRKGFYYCFGCQAKGDALTFIKENGNLSFMEAVEELAREAGMTMPARDPRAAEKADRRTQLAEVVEEAIKFYRLQLKTGAGAAARKYLTEKRRLGEPAWERWGIGWAPDNAQAVIEALAAKGISHELMVASGVVAKTDSGRFYDRFHSRIIFPIRDARGRAISLGGRSLDPNARAKYLNGPETELFDKGRNLFNLSPAREAAGKGQRLIVAEGYMDVIALSEAGFTAAVAPLGTAVTEDQLRLIWRISNEPVIALDGDKAGIRAGLRVVDLALPLLEAGKALRFALLPDGQDPDDLLQAQGPAAMQQVLDAAQPMVRLIWQRETEAKVFDSPERKAALEVALGQSIDKIKDPVIRGYYADELSTLLDQTIGRRGDAPRWGQAAPRNAPYSAPMDDRDWAPPPSSYPEDDRAWQAEGPDWGYDPRDIEIEMPSFEPAKPARPARQERPARPPRQERPWKPGQKRAAPEPMPTESARASYITTATEPANALREAVILATLLRLPQLIPRFETALERIEFSSDDRNRLLSLVLTHGHAPDCSDLVRADSPEALDRLLQNPHVRISPALRPRPDPQADEEFAAACVEEALARLQADRAHQAELAEAEKDVEGLVDEGLTWRLGKAAEARLSAARGPQEQKTEAILASNGIELDREELERKRKMDAEIDFTRGGRSRD